jgi:RNA polymerase sigma factor (sigma-70 family)
MSTHIVFDGVDEAFRARVEAYWAKKLPRLEKLLVHYNPDLKEVRLTVSEHHQAPQRARFEVQGVVHLPTGTQAARASDKDALAAIDRVVDELVREVKRHNEMVRRDYLFKRKRRRRNNLSAVGSLLQQDVKEGRRDDFFKRLRPHLEFLRDYARRELHLLEENKLLHRGEATVDDLLDEVLVMAWERFAERPRHLSLDLWLTDLLLDALEQWIKEEPRPHVSLEEKADNVLPLDKLEEETKEEEEWWAKLIGDEEALTLGDLVPGSDGTEIWDELEAKEQRERLLSLLGELPALQRQAFQMYALEGYGLAEIARLQDRPESEVKADVEAARQTLRERLLASGYVQEGTKQDASGAHDEQPLLKGE